MRPGGSGLVLQLLQGGHGSGMGGLGSLRCLLGGPDPVGHLVRVVVGRVGRLAGRLGGGGGRRGLFGEVLGDRGQLLGTLVGRVCSLLAGGGQHLGLIQDGLGLLGGPPGLLQHPPGRRPGLFAPRIRLVDRRDRRFWDHVGGGGWLRWGRPKVQAEARRIQVPREASLSQGRPGRLVAGGGRLQGGGQPGQGGVAGRMPGPKQQRLGPRAEAGDRRAQMRGRRPKLTGSTWLAGQRVLLGLAEGGAGVQQLGHGIRGGVGELVRRPGAHRRAPEAGDLAGGDAVSGGPEAADELVAGGDELLQRELVQGGQGGVQIADLGRHMR